ncbi:MAG: ATP-dependent DNA helicase RecG [Pyrinomonadaceae bacterium]
MALTLETPIVELHLHEVGKLTSYMARKLAVAIASYVNKSEPDEANVEDLLNYFPIRYEDRSNLARIDELGPGLEASVELYTRSSGAFQVNNKRAPRQNLYIYEVSAGDRERTLKPVIVWWFLSGRNAKHIIQYYDERFGRGSRFVAHGEWSWSERRGTFELKLQKPDELELLPNDEAPDEFGLLKSEPAASSKKQEKSEDRSLDEDIANPEFAMVHTARRVPIYRKLGPFQTKRLREIVYDVTKKLDAQAVPEFLPSELIEKFRLVSRADAIKEIHFPPENSQISDYAMFRSQAHRRLIFEEFFWLSFGLQLLRGERQKEPKGTVIEIPDETLRRIEAFVPFELTAAQNKVIAQIMGDMRSDAPMNRLLQGDVGSGKTIVAFIAMFVAMENGYQAALMAPTEILAEQHFRNASKIFDETGYQVGLLSGGMKAAEKRKMHAAVANGEIHLLIGTHAVIQDAVSFENLGLAVIDEQHRFGVMQRAELLKRGYNPDVLVMTATPIPRSLAMTVYGDLDVSIIDEMPPGRTPVKTVVLGEDQREGVYKGIAREVDLGRQVYVVYPLVEESEKLDLKAATKMYEELRNRIFPDRTVGLIHGRMKAAEKEETMRRFVSGELNILVSTTVIEVGVDVPNASLMVVEHAERFGLSQLHQLRGRVGRGAEQSFCVLLTGDKKTAVAKERLGIMEQTNDGFKIAEKDLEIRGQGEILGTRQSGIQNFKIANIIRDLEILDVARKEAEYYLTKRRTSNETSAMVERVVRAKMLRHAHVG